MRTTRLVAASTVGALALLLTTAGCAGGDNADRVSIGSLLGQPDYAEVDWNDQAHRIEELISVCMRDEGWQYIPLNEPDPAPPLTPEDQRAQYAERGFGIAWASLHAGEEEPYDPYAGWVDPNHAYLETLTLAEQEAWWVSLRGTDEEFDAQTTWHIDPDTGIKIYEFGAGLGWGPGCSGEAHKTVNEGDASDDQTYLEAVQALYDELQARIEADSRVIQLNASWSRCMAKAGFDFPTPLELWSDGFPGLQQSHGRIVGPGVLSADDLSPEQVEQLKALLADEIALATTYYDCSQGYDAQLAEVQAQIEARYATDHEQEISAVAAMRPQEPAR